MSTIGSTYLGIADLLKRQDPNHKIARIIESVAQLNPILEDAITLEANGQHGHRTTMRSGIPAGTFRRFYEGVQPSKTATIQVTDTAANLQNYSEVDKDFADMSGDKSELLMSEARGIIEGMQQTFASTFFYGNTANDPEKFLGLAPRFNAIASTGSGAQIVDGGGNNNGENTSIWFINWGPEHVHLFYPKGSVAGIDFKDLGEDTKVNSDGSMYQVYRSHYKQVVGLSVRDYRHVARIANIDVSDLATFGTGSDTSANLINLMIEAHGKLWPTGMGKRVIYCNQTVLTALNKMAAAKVNVNLTVEEYAGKPVTKFYGIPIRRCDAILNTEDDVS